MALDSGGQTHKYPKEPGGGPTSPFHLPTHSKSVVTRNGEREEDTAVAAAQEEVMGDESSSVWQVVVLSNFEGGGKIF